MRAMKACSQIAECNLFYAKIKNKIEKNRFLQKSFIVVIK